MLNNKILPNFQNLHITILGDIMLDRYWHGSCQKISPEAPVPVVQVAKQSERLGGAGNVALNLSQLGCQVDLLGLAGKDAEYELLMQSMQDSQITAKIHQSAQHPTITKLRVLSQHQQLIRLDFETPFSLEDASCLYPLFEESLQHTQLVILSDYAKGSLSNSQGMIEQARKHHKPVLIDPKDTSFERYRGATLITPNLKEFQAVVGECSDDNTIIERGLNLINSCDLTALLVTRSEAGMTLIQRDHPPLHLPAIAREIFDVTGAGDTVIAVLGAGIADGLSLESSATLANVAAGEVVQKMAAATISVPELRRAVARQYDADMNMVDEATLKVLVDDAKAQGETVVMTNGCFDLLHAGHVHYLQQAKSLGHRLIVAVNDDASVKILKGESRPINSVEKRMAVLAALGVVDWVVSFHEETPARLIAEILPDILVKGGDYQVTDIAGHEAVLANGGSVEVLSFLDDCSTTKTIQSIREKK